MKANQKLDQLATDLNLLMSQQAIDRYGDQIQAQAGACKIKWFTLDSMPDADGTYPIHVCFITRDITGQSTKTNVLPNLAHCYAMLRASRPLQWVHAHSAGLDRPIYAELQARGVNITSSAGANAAPVAHTAVAAVLALGRQFYVQIAAQHKRQYTPMTSHPHLHDLSGQTVLVLGLGAIGSRITRYLEALDIKVIGISRSNFSDFESHLPFIDFLVLACPLTDKTKGLVDQFLLSNMKRGSYLVNVARGEVCIEADVITALQSGHLGGAFLDGFEVEPLSTDSPLWSLPNVMLSAHTAGHFTGHADAVAQLFMSKFSIFLSEKLRKAVI